VKKGKVFAAVMTILLIGAVFAAACAPETEEVKDTLVFSSRLFSVPAEQLFFTEEVIKPFAEEHGINIHFTIIDDDTLLEQAEVQQTTGNVTTDVIVAYNGNCRRRCLPAFGQQ